MRAENPARASIAPFNPHRPRRSGAIWGCGVWGGGDVLSILTAPEGAVQYARRHQGPRSPCRLSILTAPEGAVQSPSSLTARVASFYFQSSPPPKERCNRCRIMLVPREREAFNPHRPRRSGAIAGAHAIASMSDAAFNPHRPRRSGAIGVG